MAKNTSEASFSTLLMWTAGLATIAVLPTFAYDPINVPKLAVIAAGGFMALGGLIAERKILLQRKYLSVQFFAAAFLLDLILVLLISGTNFTQEFFGTFGRATGFVAYASLCFLLVASVLASNVSTMSKLMWALIGTGGVSIIYGGLQAIGSDPFDWVSSYNPVVGFLGNPNFQSSFLGFNGIVAFAVFLGSKKTLLRISMAVDLCASVVIIVSTNSQQGLLVLAGGNALIALIWVRNSKIKLIFKPALLVSVIGAIFITLGILSKGPLASLLYQPSVTYRGDYWRAGWKMTLEHPLFGIGLDSYGDWYRRARTVEATLRRGPDVVSNAAHNVLLDISSSGGFPLLAIYLFMLGLVIIAAWRVLKRDSNFDPIFSGLFAVWVAYQAQSIISLNQLGLAIWGWIISGLLIGYEINTREISEVNIPRVQVKKRKTASAIVQQKVSDGVLVSMIIGGFVGLLLGSPPIAASSRLVTALKSQDPKLVQQAAYIWPRDARFMFQITDILVSNKLMKEAQAVSNDSILKFKDEYPIWAVRSKIEGLPQFEIDRALREMKRLDPNNPNLK